MENKSQNLQKDLSESLESQEVIYGSHDVEVFSSDSEEDPAPSENEKKIIFYMKHLEWHCAVYREALSKMPDGMKLVEEAKAKFPEDNEEKHCQSCLIENLQENIQQLQVQLQKKTSAAKWIYHSNNKKRKQ